MVFNEIETVIILTKHERIHNGKATVWTNDSVVINALEKAKATKVSEFNYELPLDRFTILPKRRNATAKNKIIVYPEIKILPNDNQDKETCIYFSQADRKKKIMHITTEDEVFLTRCKKSKLSYVDGAFVSHDDFRAYGIKQTLSEDVRAARSERMREAKKLRMSRELKV